MLFTSLHFIVFFIVVLVLNQRLKSWPTAQKLMLLAASYYFYGQWEWQYLLLIWFSTIVDYLIGRRLANTTRPRRLIAVSVLVNIGFLAIFKYANWLIATVNGGAEALGTAFHITPIDVLLPVGISFYTFQSLSYTIDVYRGELPPRRNLLDYALAVAFFPQLEAGPIVRAKEFFAELDGDKRINAGDVQRALVLIALGYVKKLVFADNLALLVDPVFDHPAAHGFWDTLLAVYGFAFQIYCDFSGYTDIATGCALLLGIRFPKNFNHPYVAESFQDFWRRWHVTLSRWLRDYLYISLGGNRNGAAHTYANLMITMLLGGLWHGASWNFVIWGGLHGLYLSFERAVLFRLRWWNSEALPMRALRVLVTFHLVCLAWVFFRAHSFEQSRTLLHTLAHPTLASFSVGDHLGLAALLLALFGAQFLGNYGRLKDRLADSRGALFPAAMAAVVLFLIWFTPAATIPFIYFQF
ncbi:MBOAT family O-acyltransferase [Dokdonella soli]|uniref:Probable alginate O-acetylase n=1 Tax=Dokdonella soli TaxID=529810 RepID=A0ABP3TQG5_9GAMM